LFRVGALAGRRFCAAQHGIRGIFRNRLNPQPITVRHTTLTSMRAHVVTNVADDRVPPSSKAAEPVPIGSPSVILTRTVMVSHGAYSLTSFPASAHDVVNYEHERETDCPSQ
jgi:hypothetical protein